MNVSRKQRDRSHLRRRTGDDGEGRLVARVAKGHANTSSELEGVNLLLGDIEGDGDGEEGTIGETEVLDDAENGKRQSGKREGGRKGGKEARQGQLTHSYMYQELNAKVEAKSWLITSKRWAKSRRRR